MSRKSSRRLKSSGGTHSVRNVPRWCRQFGSRPGSQGDHQGEEHQGDHAGGASVYPEIRGSERNHVGTLFWANPPTHSTTPSCRTSRAGPARLANVVSGLFAPQQRRRGEGVGGKTPLGADGSLPRRCRWRRNRCAGRQCGSPSDCQSATCAWWSTTWRRRRARQRPSVHARSYEGFTNANSPRLGTRSFPRSGDVRHQFRRRLRRTRYIIGDEIGPPWLLALAPRSSLTPGRQGHGVLLVVKSDGSNTQGLHQTSERLSLHVVAVRRSRSHSPARAAPAAPWGHRARWSLAPRAVRPRGLAPRVADGVRARARGVERRDFGRGVKAIARGIYGIDPEPEALLGVGNVSRVRC